MRKGEISKNWSNYIINADAQPGKNSIFYKAHKQGKPVRLLTTGCNKAIENQSRFIKNACAPLTENTHYRIRGTSHLLDIIDTISEKGIPDEFILPSLDIVNIFPSINNVKRVDAVRLVLSTRDSNKPSIECVLEGLQSFWYNSNSIFDKNHLLQRNGTATGGPNSCSYSDITINRLDQ